MWFQNRRQRSKTTQPDGKLEEDTVPVALTPGVGGKKPSVLNTSDQILEALFEFGGPGSQGGGVPGGGGSMLLPSGTDRPASLLDCESFDWALPGARNGAATSLAGLKRSGSDALLAAQALTRAPCGIADACSPLTLPKPAALSAILGFVCNVLGADACDYFRVESGEPALAQFFLPQGQLKAAEVSACRGMLVAPLCEHVMRMREMVWFGVSAEQQELLGQAGTSMRKVLAVPCTADEPPGAVAQAGTKIPGVLVIYSSSYIEPSDGIAILVRLVGAAAAAADALPPSPSEEAQPDAAAVAAAGGLDSAAVPSYAAIPSRAGQTNMGWLLLAAAHALGTDVAEHWRVRQPDERGAALMLEQLLASGTVQNSPQLVREIGTAEAAHPFSSQMCQATLYACKLIWCHATAASGVLEGLRLPMHTSVGLPICDRSGATSSVLVLYSLRRLEETPAAQCFLEQLQVLAAAVQEFSAAVPLSMTAFEAAANAHANTHTVSTPSTRSVCPQQQGASVPSQLMQPGGGEGSLQGAGSMQEAELALQQLLQQQAELQGQRALHALLQPQEGQAWPPQSPSTSPSCSAAQPPPPHPPQPQQPGASPAATEQAALQMQGLQAMLLQQQHVLHQQRALQQQQAFQQQQQAAQPSQAPTQTPQQSPAAAAALLVGSGPRSASTAGGRPSSRPSSAPPCPVEQLAAVATVRSAALPDAGCAASVDVVLPAGMLNSNSNCGTAGFDMSADQVLSLLDDIRWPAEQLDGNDDSTTTGGGRMGTSPPPMAVDVEEEEEERCGRGQPEEAEAGSSPLSVTFTAEAMELAANRKPSPAKPLPRSKLPTFEPLPLMHSGLSGDLDALLLPDELEDDSHLACA